MFLTLCVLLQVGLGKGEKQNFCGRGILLNNLPKSRNFPPEIEWCKYVWPNAINNINHSETWMRRNTKGKNSAHAIWVFWSFFSSSNAEIFPYLMHSRSAAKALLIAHLHNALESGLNVTTNRCYANNMAVFRKQDTIFFFALQQVCDVARCTFKCRIR